jgi:ABC-type transport system involved in cytochrome c biogenesis permease subunit
MSERAANVLLLSAMMVAAGAYYKFTHKALMPLFLLQFIGTYCALCVLHVLLACVPAKQLAGRKEKAASHFKYLHMFWWAMALLGLTMSKCSQEDFYPKCFYVNVVLMGVLFVYAFFQTDKSYEVRWEKDELKAMQLFDA